MRNTIRSILVVLFALTGTSLVKAQGTAFTYQGRLAFSNAVVTGLYDMTFKVFDAASAGAQVGPTTTTNAVGISNGLFTVRVDPGAGVFAGANRWLEIAVKTNGGPTFSNLVPRQPLTPSPYAIFAGGASSVSTAAVNTAAISNGAVTLTKLAAGVLDPSNFPPNSVTSRELADFIALGSSNAFGQLDVYHTTASTPAISLMGSGSQISTYGSDGLEQIRLWGPSWGEVLLFDSTANNNMAVNLSANSAAGGALTLLQAATNIAGASLFGDGIGGGRLYFNNRSNTTAVDFRAQYDNSAPAAWGALYDNGSERIAFAARNAITGQGGLIDVKNTNSTATIRLFGDDGAGNGELRMATAAGVERIHINASGGVGIGTATPQDGILDIEGDTHINDHDIFLRSGSDRNHGLGYRTNINNGAIGVDGPFLYGFNGGALGVGGPDSATLTWNYVGDVWVSNTLSAATLNSRGNVMASARIGAGIVPQHTIHAGSTLNVGAINGAPNKIVVENSAANGRAAFLALAGSGSIVSTNRVEVQLEADEGQRRGIFGTTSAHEMQFRINNNEIMKLYTNLNVGIGVSAPTNKLHVNGGATFGTGSGAANQNVVWVPGSASWSFTSDRKAKERITPVDARAVLDKLSRLPVAEWNYIGYGQRHIGPMAQDFHAQFPLNNDDKSLNDADLHGVALAAIQGLNEKVESENAKLRKENEQLKARLEKLERLIRSGVRP